MLCWVMLEHNKMRAMKMIHREHQNQRHELNKESGAFNIDRDHVCRPKANYQDASIHKCASLRKSLRCFSVFCEKV